MSAPAQAARDRLEIAAAIRTGSKSFHAASRLLPARVRDPALVLYAFCRLADDAVDLQAEKPAAVLALRDRLDRVYAGRPADAAADRAFAIVVRDFDLPRELPDALLEGFAWDAIGRTYAGLSDLSAYATRVAGTVGAMMTVLMGVRDAAALARACDLGIAMQFTNIARDVGEDAREGRLYLPLDWLAEEGIDPAAFLARPSHSPALARVVARLLAEAEALYRRAESGIPLLPMACRPAIHAARLIYAEIGAVIAAAGHDSMTTRAHTGRGRKLALLARSAAQAPLVRPGPARDAPPVPEAAFLVAAAARTARPRSVGTRVNSLIEVLAELEYRDRQRRAVPPQWGGSA